MSKVTLNESNITSIEKVNEAQKVDTKKKNVLSTWTCSYMKFEDVNENNRWYSRDIGVKKILNKTVTNKLKQGNGLLMEIDHPESRFTINMDYVCACTTNLWYDEKKNELWGTFDVLDTPRGRIVNTLLEYGFPVGVSARAMGKTVERKGRNEVDVDSYVFKTFDLVVQPGFSTSTVTINESINEALTTLYESYTEEDKEIAKDLLEILNVTPEVIYSNESIETGELDSNSSVEEDSSQLNENVHEQKIKELEILLHNANRHVCDLKTKLVEKEDKIDSLEDLVVSTNEQLENKISHINSLDEVITNLKETNKTLQEKYETLEDDNKANSERLMEAMNDIYQLKDYYDNQTKKVEEAHKIIKTLQDKIVDLNESLHASEQYSLELETLLEDNNAKKSTLVSNLNEAYAELKELKTEEYTPKKKKDLGIQVLSVINESTNVNYDEDTFNLLKNLNKKEHK